MLPRLLLQVMLIVITCVPVTTTEQAALPAPENISITSTNLKHFLSWNPVIAHQGNVTYSVEFQGEYERTLKTPRWHEVEKCQAISAQQCNVTDDIAASVPYILRVRAELGNQTSMWATMTQPFNRNTSVLIPPVISLHARELHLILDIEDFGRSFNFYVFYWRKGSEDKVKSLTKSYARAIFLSKVEEGEKYCAQVIAYARPINRNSSRSLPVCVTVQAPRPPDIVIVLVSLIGVIVGFILLSLLVWKCFRMMWYSCCPQVDIPDSLNEPFSPQKMIRINYSEIETCDLISPIEIRDDNCHPLKSNDFIIKTHLLQPKTPGTGDLKRSA
ncbi:interleukin-20 receptor subunit beta [Rhinophrynus dorsalis]